MVCDQTNTQPSPGAAARLLPAMLAIVVTAILVPVPQPIIAVNQPYRVEILLAGFLLLVILGYQNTLSGGSRDDRLLRFITSAITIFVLWSAASFFWAPFFGGVVHHTLLWGLYLGFLLVAVAMLRAGNARFVTETFVLVAGITALLALFDYAAITDFSVSELTIRARYAKSGEMLAVISPVLCAAALYARRARFVLWAAAALGWIALMLSLSKGAFIAGILGLSIFFAGSIVFGHIGFRKRTLIAVGACIVLTVGVQALSSVLFAVPSTADYITGAADPHRTSTGHRLFIWKVGLQTAADNWLLGVGADNFGLVLNRYRAQYRESYPDNPAEEIAETNLIDRAHNEPLQILSELGVVGLVLILIPLSIFAVYFARAFRHQNYRLSPILWAAVGGMAAFLVSSQFSSFSFRKASNGIVFFMVFALAINELAKLSPRTDGSEDKSLSLSKSIRTIGFACSILMLLFGATKITAEFRTYQAEQTASYSQAKEHYLAAFQADPEYAGAYLSNAERAAANGDIAGAARLTRIGIDKGIGQPMTYSHLAAWLGEIGDADGSEATFREAIAIYPNSVFLRMEYSVFLEQLGRDKDAAAQAEAARKVSPRQAAGWYFLIKDRSTSAFFRSRSADDIAPPAELTPADAVVRYLDELPSGSRLSSN